MSWWINTCEISQGFHQEVRKCSYYPSRVVSQIWSEALKTISLLCISSIGWKTFLIFPAATAIPLKGKLWDEWVCPSLSWFKQDLINHFTKILADVLSQKRWPACSGHPVDQVEQRWSCPVSISLPSLGRIEEQYIFHVSRYLPELHSQDTEEAKNHGNTAETLHAHARMQNLTVKKDNG